MLFPFCLRLLLLSVLSFVAGVVLVYGSCSSCVVCCSLFFSVVEYCSLFVRRLPLLLFSFVVFAVCCAWFIVVRCLWLLCVVCRMMLFVVVGCLL